MKKIRAYRSTEVKNVCLDRALEDRDGQRVDVGLDVGQESVRAGKISDATNSTVVFRRYVPGKRFELPDT